MPTFVAQVKNRYGKVFQEKIEAMSPDQARMMLKAKYATVGKVKKAGVEIDLSGLELMFASISIKDKAVFSRQFSVMINAGVGIVRCLGVLGDQCGNPKMRKALQAISAEVQQGSPLSEAMAKHPECFDELYVSMIEAEHAINKSMIVEAYHLCALENWGKIVELSKEATTGVSLPIVPDNWGWAIAFVVLLAICAIYPSKKLMNLPA